MGQNKCTGYLAPPDFESDLKVELSLLGITILETHGRLFLCVGEAQDVVFAQDTWHDVERVEYTSISNAAEVLRVRAGRWSHFSLNNHRRAELILEKVPSVKIKRYHFLDPIPN
jgi:23S rRNA (cytidine2498-2'-O)-methyltransferase